MRTLEATRARPGPASRRRSAADHPRPRQAAPAAAYLLRLQRQAGNRAVLQLLASSAVVQRDTGDVRIEAIVDRLQGAIKDDSRTVGDVHQSFISVDVDKAAAALEGLTATEGKAVESAWGRRDKRALRDIIAGKDLGRGNDAYLEPSQRRRLLGLLDGTVFDPGVPPADPWDPDAGRREVEARGLTIDVTRLGEAIKVPAARDTVFEILGRRGGPPGSPAFVALNDAYKQQWDTGLYVDITRYLRDADGDRAEALLEGRTQAAAGLELQDLMARRYRATATPAERTYRDAIEARLEQLRAEAGGDPELVRQLLAQQVAGAGGDLTLGKQLMAESDEATRKVIEALTSGSDAAVIAAKLARTASEGRLKGTDVEQALIETRRRALMAATAAMARDPAAAELSDDQRRLREQHALTTGFQALSAAYTQASGRTLEGTIATTGTEVERRRNLELLRGMGAYVADPGVGGDKAQRRSAAFIELDLALESWDAGRIKAVLAGRTKDQIDTLADEYERHRQMNLQRRLYLMKSLAVKGWSPKGATLDEHAIDEFLELFRFGGAYQAPVGADRLAALVAEGRWYWDRIERLYDRTMDARGLFASLRDWKGNQEHELVDLAKARAKQAYDGLTAAGKVKSMKTTAEAIDLVADLKASYDRLRYNVDVYNESTKAAFTSFVELAVNLVSIAISFTTGGAGAMLLRNVIGVVGTKLVLLREDYSAGEFVRDVLGQAGGALGGQVAGSILARGIGGMSQAARVAGLRLSPEISALATRGAGWVADQVGSTAGTKLATTGELELPSLSEWLDAAALTLAHKGKAAVTKPKAAPHATTEPHEGPGGRAGAPGGHEAPAKPVVHEQPQLGVRRGAELPGGGSLKLLENGKVASCFSPCRVDDTMASQVQERFGRELAETTREAQNLKRQAEELWARERAAIDAGDVAARDALFTDIVDLNHRLADYRNRQLSARSGLPLPRVNQLVRLAQGDAPMVERWLHHTRGDSDRVEALLTWAQGDPETLARMDYLAGQLDRRWEPGGAFIDPRLEPYARSANMAHFLGAHTFEYFGEYERPELTGFWPKGTTRGQVEEYVVEAVQKLRAEGFVAPIPPAWWNRVVRLDNGIMVQIGYNGGVDWLGQFYPIDGPGVYHISRDEVHAVALTLGRI